MTPLHNLGKLAYSGTQSAILIINLQATRAISYINLTYQDWIYPLCRSLAFAPRNHEDTNYNKITTYPQLIFCLIFCLIMQLYNDTQCKEYMHKKVRNVLTRQIFLVYGCGTCILAITSSDSCINYVSIGVTMEIITRMPGIHKLHRRLSAD